VFIIEGAVVAPLRSKRRNTMYRNMDKTNAADARELTEAELNAVTGGTVRQQPTNSTIPINKPVFGPATSNPQI
jgi:bacteriocin-like protein